MGEIVNLRQFRKAREKVQRAAKAAENRALFGRPKASKTLAETRNAVEVARLDAHRLDGPEKE